MRKEKDIVLLIVTVFLIVTCCLFVPSSLFLGNIDEFRIDYIDIIPVIGIICLIALAFCLVLFVLLIKKKGAYITLIFGMALGCYLQSNFMNPDFGSLNGNEINWGAYSGATVIGMIVWLLCIAGTGVLVLSKWKYALTIIKMIALFLTTVQVVTLIVLIITTNKKSLDDFVITKDDEFVLSNEKNTIVFVVDTLDAQWFEDVILSDSESIEKLKGFTYYSNVVSGGAPTAIGMPTLLTGRIFHPDIESRDEYYQRAYNESSFFRDLENEHVAVKLFTENEVLYTADIENVENIVPGSFRISSYFDFAKRLSKLVLFNVMPISIKKRFLIYTGDLTNLIVMDDTEHDYERYLLDDPQFYSDLTEQGVVSGDEKKMLCLYHLFGAHGFYTMNEFSERIPETRSDEGRINQIRGSFNIIFQFINLMKKAELYDNCTFVITADHGAVALYQNPAVLIKPAHCNEGLKIDDKEATFQNLRASIASSLLEEYDKEEYGDTLMESGNIIGERHHSCDSVLVENLYPDVKVTGEYTEFIINGNAREKENISFLSDNRDEQQR